MKSMNTPISPMRLYWTILSLVLGVASMAFGYWGLMTEAGRVSFDEMDGMIPFAVGIAGIAIVVVAACFAAFMSFTGRTRRGSVERPARPDRGLS
jgi:heme/copper-type cytochrome/quinol oxidase subunit 2